MVIQFGLFMVMILAGPAEDPTAAPGLHNTTHQNKPVPLERLRRGKTRRICQVTGTSINFPAELGLRGSDLGVSFPCGDKLCFLFGDSWTTDPLVPGAGKHDSVAFGALCKPELGEGLVLDWLRTAGGRYKPLKVKGLALGCMEVPVEGICLDDRIYLFFSSGWEVDRQRHRFSALTHTELGGEFDLDLDYRAETDRFINVSAELKREEGQEEPWIYLWGTGPFRKSRVYLARVPASKITDRSAYRYYIKEGPGGAIFVSDEAEAKPLFKTSSLGELSVVWHPDLQVWLMAYNLHKPSGIYLRMAQDPQGPWSEPIQIFKPWKDQGNTCFLHVPAERIGGDDGLSDPHRDNEWGGVYGPYLIPSYFHRTGNGSFTIVYMLSSWNPYQVHLMETELLTVENEPNRISDEGPSPGLQKEFENPEFKSGLHTGWKSDGDAFHLIENAEGDICLTTLDRTRKRGQAAMGSLWQEFSVDPAWRFLRFDLFGGFACVKLYEGNDVVRCSYGPGRHKVPRHVRWNLLPFRNRMVRLVIEDNVHGDWGFVTVKGFQIEKE